MDIKMKKTFRTILILLIICCTLAIALFNYVQIKLNWEIDAWLGFTGNIIGAVIGGIVTAFALYKTISDDDQKFKKQRDDNIQINRIELKKDIIKSNIEDLKEFIHNCNFIMSDLGRVYENVEKYANTKSAYERYIISKEIAKIIVGNDDKFVEVCWCNKEYLIHNSYTKFNTIKEDCIKLRDISYGGTKADLADKYSYSECEEIIKNLMDNRRLLINELRKMREDTQKELLDKYRQLNELKMEIEEFLK